MTPSICRYCGAELRMVAIPTMTKSGRKSKKSITALQDPSGQGMCRTASGAQTLHAPGGSPSSHE